MFAYTGEVVYHIFIWLGPKLLVPSIDFTITGSAIITLSSTSTIDTRTEPVRIRDVIVVEVTIIIDVPNIAAAVRRTI